MTKSVAPALDIAALAQAIALALAPTLAGNNAPAQEATGKGKGKAKKAPKRPEIEGTFGADENYAPTGALTRANYAATLAAARAAGHPWADGSNKPIVHILKRAGAKWSGASERAQVIASAKATIAGK